MPVSGSRSIAAGEMIHGTHVRDPYRWLEDRSLPETEEWIEAQQRRYDTYFADCPALPAIREQVRKYLDIDVFDQPAKIRDRYFYRRRLRGQEQGSIYVRDAITGVEHLLVDPSDDGPFVSVGIHRISPDGSLLAYERRCGGEDKKSIHVVDVKTGTPQLDAIDNGYARGFVFLAGSRGFCYCQEPTEDATEHTICLHLFGEASANQVVFRTARSRGSRLILTCDTVHLGALRVHEAEGQLRQDFWMARQDHPANWRQVFANKTLALSPILSGGRLFAISHQDARNGKFVELGCEGEEMRTIIPEQGTVIRQLLISGGCIFIMAPRGLHSGVRFWNLDGEHSQEIELPGPGTPRLLPGLGDGSSVFLNYESFTEPRTIFECIPPSPKLSVRFQRPMAHRTHPATIRNVSYPSADGIRIPMTLVCKGDSESGRPSPVVMTTYGGFGVPATPQYSVLISILMNCGVVFALPHVRGGSEFGKEWHDAARGRNKQVTFDDFVASAEWLQRKCLTTPQQLAIFGGSNSGLLVGAAMTQRPDLFRAVLCVAPLLDMVRYEHFDQAGKWKTEYGSTEIAEDFHALYAYSPYHRINDDTEYPAVLFVTGDKDDRCNPAHARKMTARLLDGHLRKNPVLIDYTPQRGHAPALPLSVRIEALARRIAFLCRELNLICPPGGSDEAAPS
jgi:prolyl oligopeptidase